MRHCFEVDIYTDCGILFKRRDFTLRRCEFDRHLCSH